MPHRFETVRSISIVMAEIEIIADFSMPTKKSESRAVGGLIGWKCSQCNSQNQISIKTCKKCNNTKPSEGISKNKVAHILNSNTNGNAEKKEHRNTGITNTRKEKVSGNFIPGNEENRHKEMSNSIIQDVPHLFAGQHDKNKNSEQWGEIIYRGGQSNQVQNLSRPLGLQSNDRRGSNPRGGFRGHIQDLPQPLMKTMGNEKRMEHKIDRNVRGGFDDRVQNIPLPLMGLDANQNNEGRASKNIMGSFNNQEREMPPHLRNMEGNQKGTNAFAGMHRGLNSHVQELPTLLQDINYNHKPVGRWAGNMKDHGSFQREHREEQKPFSQGFGGFQGAPPNYQDKVINKLQEVFKKKPTNELANIDMEEKKFNMRARLFIGNLGDGTTEKQLKDMISKHGEIGETFFQKEKRFAFFRMATRSEAETAKRALDGNLHNGRNMKVRLSPHQGAIKVSNLSPWVSNELLYLSFSIFGDIERAFVSCDERGQSKEEGIVEFVNKHSAMESVRRCIENCFFLTTTLRPVFVEVMDGLEPDEDGLQDHMLQKRNQEFFFERSSIPRFAKPESFEFEYGNKWKQLYEMKTAKLQALDREMKLEESKLIAQMEFSRYEHETESLRATLRQKEVFCEKQKEMWTVKQQQMDTLILREKEKRKALNISLGRDTKSGVDPKNATGKPLETGNLMKDVATNSLWPVVKKDIAPFNQSRSIVDNPNMVCNPSYLSYEKLEKDKFQQMLPHLAPGRNVLQSTNQNNPNFDQLKMYQNTVHNNIPSNVTRSNDVTSSEPNTQYIGKFEKEIKQMFPHLANFNTTFANPDAKPGQVQQQSDQKYLNKKQANTILKPDPDFGSINPLMQPPEDLM